MDVTLSGRMGGPEAGVRFLPAIVTHRPRLKAALADVAVAGLATLHLELFIGGSISEYADGGFQATSRYRRQQQTLTVAIQVPRREAMAVQESGVDAAVSDWVTRGIEAMTLPASVRGLDLRALRTAVAAG